MEPDTHWLRAPPRIRFGIGGDAIRDYTVFVSDHWVPLLPPNFRHADLESSLAFLLFSLKTPLSFDGIVDCK